MSEADRFDHVEVGFRIEDGSEGTRISAFHRAGERFLVLRGTADGRKYVRKLLPDLGEVEWTKDRSAAHRFSDHGAATYVQRCIVAHDGGAVAVVPETANTRAMASLNQVAEW